MLVMPSTGKGHRCGDLYDPPTNVRCGVYILSRLLRRYQGNEIYALGAYNGGPGYIRKARKAQELPRNLEYVERVLHARTRYLEGRCEALVRKMRHRR